MLQTLAAMVRHAADWRADAERSRWGFKLGGPPPTHRGHRGFRKAADQPDGSPASFASRKLPFAASHTRPVAACHKVIRIAAVR